MDIIIMPATPVSHIHVGRANALPYPGAVTARTTGYNRIGMITWRKT